MSRNDAMACSSFGRDVIDHAGFAAMGLGAAHSSAEITSPVAAFTKGGPPRKMVLPCAR